MDKETKDMLSQLFKEVVEIKNMVSKSALEESYVDTEEICKKLKLSKKSIGRYRNLNYFPHYKLGRKVYFKLSEVKEALKKHLYGI